MNKEQALEALRKEFHKTRITQKIYVDPEIIAAILDYDYKPMTYEQRAKRDDWRV